LPIICGGTGFWISAIVDNKIFPEVKPNKELRKKLQVLSVDNLYKKLLKLDPERAKNIDRKNNKYPSQAKPETFTNMNEELFLNKIKYENKNIENVALSLITIIILVFLLVMFNSIKK
jgi:tRNA dimethylallyltransferase